MEKITFSERLASACRHARSFAQECVIEILPEALVFEVKLNASYDGNPLRSDEIVFPEDNGRHEHCESYEEVASLLWRDGYVPEWINVSVQGIDGSKTTLEILCCGRFTKNEAYLYHEREKRPPFQVLGPSMPPGERQPGEKFSLFWSIDLPVEKLASFTSPEQVISLRLHGAGANREALSGLKKFSRLHHLSFKGTDLTDYALPACADFDGLEGLNLDDTNISDRGLSHLSQLRALTSLSLSRTHISDAGIEALRQLSSLWWLTLDETKITGKTLQGSYQNSLRMLSATDSNFNDDGCKALESFAVLNHLNLKNTPITSKGLDSLVKLSSLRGLNVSGTQITEPEQLQLMTKLRKLWLDEVHVDQSYLDWLRSKLPKLDIKSE